MTEKQRPAWIAFGQEVRRLRAHAGLSLDQVARSLSVTSGMLSKIERATRPANRDTAAELDHFFGTDGALMRKWSDATTTSTTPDWFRQILKSEQRATEIRTWSPILCPGYLQIPAYARAIFRAGRPLAATEDIERLVSDRAERFDFLTRKGGPTLWAVLCESVLSRSVGGNETMTEQLSRLVDLGESGRVRIQVVPAETPDCPGNSGPFRLITTHDGTTLLYSEGSGGGQVVDTQTVVRQHVATYGDLQGLALPPRASLDLIRRRRDDVA